MNTTKQELYSVWIADSDGSNGRWMSDRSENKDIWSGSLWEAHGACSGRSHLYRHVKYEVKPSPPDAD